MDKSTTKPSGLVAIRGLTRDKLDPICKVHGAYVAIVNAEDQMLVGGTRKALEAITQDARAAGAERTTMLPVAVPSHTPLLAEASKEFRQALFNAHLPEEVPPDVRLLSGIDGDTVIRRAPRCGKAGAPDRTDGGLGCVHGVVPGGRRCQSL
jgi:[acyl-carrier-protein] S-malonyltransferase